ncbi:hypothetical protein JGG70_24365 [Salmonella enterica subsp. enterica serovar Typhimurium]|nr:hypothetical protein [Salmonella enterica subsp. enterica serovar Typhimurium]
MERRIRRHAAAAPQSTTVTILQKVQDVVDALISARTIPRRLDESGLQPCRSLRRLPLTQSHRSQRLQWCRDRASWTTEWHRIVFSDESRFCVSSDSRRISLEVTWRQVQSCCDCGTPYCLTTWHHGLGRHLHG